MYTRSAGRSRKKRIKRDSRCGQCRQQQHIQFHSAISKEAIPARHTSCVARCAVRRLEDALVRKRAGGACIFAFTKRTVNFFTLFCIERHAFAYKYNTQNAKMCIFSPFIYSKKFFSCCKNSILHDARQKFILAKLYYIRVEKVRDSHCYKLRAYTSAELVLLAWLGSRTTLLSASRKRRHCGGGGGLKINTALQYAVYFFMLMPFIYSFRGITFEYYSTTLDAVILNTLSSFVLIALLTAYFPRTASRSASSLALAYVLATLIVNMFSMQVPMPVFTFNGIINGELRITNFLPFLLSNFGYFTFLYALSFALEHEVSLDAQ